MLHAVPEEDAAGFEFIDASCYTPLCTARKKNENTNQTKREVKKGNTPSWGRHTNLSQPSTSLRISDSLIDFGFFTVIIDLDNVVHVHLFACTGQLYSSVVPLLPPAGRRPVVCRGGNGRPNPSGESRHFVPLCASSAVRRERPNLQRKNRKWERRRGERSPRSVRREMNAMMMYEPRWEDSPAGVGGGSSGTRRAPIRNHRMQQKERTIWIFRTRHNYSLYFGWLVATGNRWDSWQIGEERPPTTKVKSSTSVSGPDDDPTDRLFSPINSLPPTSFVW